MRTFLNVVAVACVFVAIWAVLMYGTEKTEIHNCLNYQEQATQYPDYYITKYQADICGRHSITIEAPIKR
jgi:hypothetical protein